MLNHVQLYATSMDCSPPGSSRQAAKEILKKKKKIGVLGVRKKERVVEEVDY